MSRYALIRKNDIANGVGIRTTFWVQGCHWRCKNCHNKEQWDFKGGFEFTQDTVDTIIKYISDDGIRRDFTILGGEPFEKINIPMCIEVLKQVRQAYPDINVWVYTGYLYEDLLKDDRALEFLKLVDVLVDGLFVEALYNINLKFKGSTNQRIIDVKESLDKKEVKEIRI